MNLSWHLHFLDFEKYKLAHTKPSLKEALGKMEIFLQAVLAYIELKI
jgi:hypothetical protein